MWHDLCKETSVLDNVAFNLAFGNLLKVTYRKQFYIKYHFLEQFCSEQSVPVFDNCFAQLLEAADVDFITAEYKQLLNSGLLLTSVRIPGRNSRFFLGTITKR